MQSLNQNCQRRESNLYGIDIFILYILVIRLKTYLSLWNNDNESGRGLVSPVCVPVFAPHRPALSLLPRYHVSLSSPGCQ